MKLRRRHLSLWCLLLAYGAACWWVFTRSTPVWRQRPVTIYFAHWQIERGPPAGIDAVIRRYEELNPRVHVVQLAIPGGTIYPQWLRSNLAGGTGADLLEWGSWVPGTKDIPARYFTPLTAELTKPNPYNRGTSQERVAWQDTFHDGLLAPRRESPDPGQIYAVNLTEHSLRLFANVPLMRQIAGRTVELKTFDDFRRLLVQTRAYAERTGHSIAGIAGSRDTTRTLVEPLLVPTMLREVYEMDEGGQLFLYNRQLLAGYLEGKWRYSDPAVKAAFGLLREVTDAMKPGFQQLRRDDAMLEFLRGQALFFFYGTWDATSLRQLASFEIKTYKLPPVTPDDPKVGPMVLGIMGEGMGETGLSMYLNKDSAHPAEALDFLKFITSVPGNQLFTDHSLWLPAVNGVVVPEPIRNFRDYLQGYAFGQAPIDAIGSEASMEWDRHFYELVGEQGSVDRFAATMDRLGPKAIRTDLMSELRNTLLLVKPQDVQIVGWAGQAGEAARTNQAELEMGQTMSEGLALQMRRVLDRTGN